MGKGGGCAGSGAGYDDWMEAHRGDRRRKNRQEPPDLRTGRGGGNYGDGDNWRSGRIGLAGQYDSRAVVGSSGNNDGQRLRPAMGNGAKPAAGLGADIARRYDTFGLPVRGLPQTVPRLILLG